LTLGTVGLLLFAVFIASASLVHIYQDQIQNFGFPGFIIAINEYLVLGIPRTIFFFVRKLYEKIGRAHQNGIAQNPNVQLVWRYTRLAANFLLFVILIGAILLIVYFLFLQK
jgi:hypothetical protein